MVKQVTLREIVSALGGELVGNPDTAITRLATLSNARDGQISFLSNPKYLAQLKATQASAVVIGHAQRDATSIPRVVVDDPYVYFAKLSAYLNPSDIKFEISPHANIGKGVKLGQKLSIAAGVFIGNDVEIGDHTVIGPNVTIYQGCKIGRNCVIAAGAVIGSDGFGYAESDGRWVKIPQVGSVVIEDDVEIGANTTIDRGAIDDTVIAQGVKIDNLVQIAHNCRIGAHTVIAGCVGIAGSAVIGAHCKIGGAAMILGHLTIADSVTISPGSMITRSLNQTETYTALMPFQTHEEWLKTAANIRRLGELSERVRALERLLDVKHTSKKTGKK